ncbi:hypothetical protein ACWD5V_41165 [Streptomyces sp. NPDC002523]
MNRAEQLARSARQGRAPVALSTVGLDQALRKGSPSALRAVITGRLHHRTTYLGAAPQALAAADFSEVGWDERAEAMLEATAERARRAQEPPQMHNLLLDAAAGQGLNVEDVPRMPPWKEIRPLVPVILRVLTSGRDAVGLEEITEAVGAGLGLPEPLIDDMTMAMAADQLARIGRGEGPHVLSPYLDSTQTLAEAVGRAGDEELMRTTATVLFTAQFQVIALLASAAALQSAPPMPLTMQPEGVVRMLQHPLWILWGQFISAGTLHREGSLAVLIAEALDPRRPVNAEALRGYLRFLRVELGLPDEDITAIGFAGPVV